MGKCESAFPKTNLQKKERKKERKEKKERKKETQAFFTISDTSV